MRRRRHRHLHRHLTTLRPSWKQWWCLTSRLKSLQRRKFRHFYKHWQKKKRAHIYKLVARLKEVQFKVIGDTVTTMETKALVETLSDRLINIKSRRRTTQ